MLIGTTMAQVFGARPACLPDGRHFRLRAQYDGITGANIPNVGFLPSFPEIFVRPVFLLGTSSGREENAWRTVYRGRGKQRIGSYADVDRLRSGTSAIMIKLTINNIR
jgi:hypothetical protein